MRLPGLPKLFYEKKTLDLKVSTIIDSFLTNDFKDNDNSAANRFRPLNTEKENHFFFLFFKGKDLMKKIHSDSFFLMTVNEDKDRFQDCGFAESCFECFRE